MKGKEGVDLFSSSSSVVVSLCPVTTVIRPTEECHVRLMAIGSCTLVVVHELFYLLSSSSSFLFVIP
jgi:hypothetical protein